MSQMTQQTLNEYRAQVKRGELLDRDQQFAVIMHGLTLFAPTEGEPTAVVQQDLRERENNAKEALRDINDAIAEARAGGDSHALHRAHYLIVAAVKMFRSRKTKDVKNWADWKEMAIEEGFVELQSRCD